MSYDIRILDPVTRVPVILEHPHFIQGGTYAEQGTNELWFNITYNYAPFYYRAETLGESTKVYGEEPVDGCLPVLREETGGIPGLAFLTIPQARERVLRAIHALRDESIDKEGKHYSPVKTCFGNDISSDSYWAPTERNARRALLGLMEILLLAPDNAIIEVS